MRFVNVRRLLLPMVFVILGLCAACGDESTPRADADPGDDAQVATTFAEFPILWLGQSYDPDGDEQDDWILMNARVSRNPGLVHPITGERITHALTSFAISYGNCEIPPGDQSCPVPLTIVFYPADSPIPPIATSLRDLGPVIVRGVEAIPFSSGLWIETADFKVTIAFGGTREDTLEPALRVASMLVAANDLASHITPGSDFRPPVHTPTVEPTTQPDDTPTPDSGVPTPDTTSSSPVETLEAP